jgi:cation:H+ antiporter
MVWRLESMAAEGMEGTVLGTVVMPYCTGMSNLIFAIVLGMHGGSGAEVVTNCLVNNVTNLTLLVGFPAALWGMSVLPDKAAKSGQDCSHHLKRLSMMLTLMAVLFFTGTAWVVGRRREIGLGEGLILIGLFLCWQAFHVLKRLAGRAAQRPDGILLRVEEAGGSRVHLTGWGCAYLHPAVHRHICAI